MELPSTFGFYLNIAFNVKQSKRSFSHFILPNAQENNNYLIPISEATDISTKIMKRYKFPDSYFQNIKHLLTSEANKDLFWRVAHSKSVKKDKDVGRETLISFDALAGYTFLTKMAPEQMDRQEQGGVHQPGHVDQLDGPEQQVLHANVRASHVGGKVA